MITIFHAKYFAYELIRRHVSNDIDRLSRSLFDASVDLREPLKIQFKTTKIKAIKLFSIGLTF
jgi:hypothetical protein